MDKEGKFLIYCIERYRNIKGLSGAEVVKLFNEYGIMDFIRQFFDLLHINGDEYIVQEIDDYIAEQKAGLPKIGE
ncbi:MAG: DUF3791 domain-containing protein [Victivallales bacterium]|jgi:hypothetical protein|nr:DUF3791 domain-containing protein [Victivallales bacterium]